MNLAIDIGGSKTLLAVFDGTSKPLKEFKFPTNKDLPTFLQDLEKAIKSELQDYQFNACCCAVPGLVDRQNGVAKYFGNLPWTNVPIKSELGKILGNIPIYIENDANLAGLSEALLVQDKYKRVLYLTISTGIGDGFIIDGVIDPEMADSEAGQMTLSHDGKTMKWEEFASGKAIVRRFGKTASELEDQDTWRIICRDLAEGINTLTPTIRPNVIIIGGGVGAHFDKFGDFLKAELAKNSNPMVTTPDLIQAQKPEEAVIYGCNDYIAKYSS